MLISNKPFLLSAPSTLQRFQDLEEAHLKQMKEFLSSYMEIVQNNFDLVGQVGAKIVHFESRLTISFPFKKVHQDLKRQFLELTVDKLLEQFVLNKYTGLEKPGKYTVLHSSMHHPAAMIRVRVSSAPRIWSTQIC